MVSLTNMCMVFTAKPRKCFDSYFLICRFKVYIESILQNGCNQCIHWCILLLVYGLWS